MALVNQGGGGGRAGGDVDDNYALDKPYDVGGDPTADKMQLIDEMLATLFKSLTRGRSGILANADGLSALTTTVAGLPSGSSSSAVVPAILEQYYYAWLANYVSASGDVVQAIGTVVPAREITGSSNNFAWVNTFASLPYLNVNYVASASATRNGYIPSTNVVGGIKMDHGITVDIFMATGTPINTSGVDYRYWFGLFNISTAITGTSDTAPATDFAAFRYSTTAGDGTAAGVGTWQLVTRDNSVTNVTSSGVAFGLETEFHLRIRLTSTVVYFSINGGSEIAVSSNIPRTGQALFPQLIVQKDASALGRTAPWYLNRMVVRVGSPLSLT